MKKYKLIKTQKALLNTKLDTNKINKSSKNKEICENYYRVNDVNGDGRGEF